MEVVYCEVCTLPPEYCEYNSKTKYKECKEWLLSHHIDLYRKLYPEEQIAEEKTSNDNQATEAAKAEQTQQQQQPKKKKAALNQIIISKKDRSKKKSVTHLQNLTLLSQADPDFSLKKLSKTLSQKFACSASVSINEQTKEEEILIQGDVMDQLADYMKKEFKLDNSQILVKEGK